MKFIIPLLLTIVIGILGAQIINLIIAEEVPIGATDEFIRASWNGQVGWRWMFFVCAVPSAVFFCTCIYAARKSTLVNESRKTRKSISYVEQNWRRSICS